MPHTLVLSRRRQFYSNLHLLLGALVNEAATNFFRGKCKTWTLDSGLDSWTGLWTKIWTRFWTDAQGDDDHFQETADSAS